MIGWMSNVIIIPNVFRRLKKKWKMKNKELDFFWIIKSLKWKTYWKYETDCYWEQRNSLLCETIKYHRFTDKQKK